MKALALGGPWAAFERRNLENESRIRELECQVSRWQQEVSSSRALAECLQQQVSDQLPVHKDQANKARALVTRLDSELRQMQLERDEAHAQAQHLRHALAAANAEINSQRSELTRLSNIKATTTGKLDEIRRALGLSDAEGQHFIKELDSAVQSNKALRSEVAELSLARTQLQQQCDSRSQHCMTLIAEGKRNAEQVSELRRQVLDLQHDEWQLKQQLAASKKQLERKHPVVLKERPHWQDASSANRKADGPRQHSTAGVQDAAGRRCSNDGCFMAEHGRAQAVRAVLADKRNQLACAAASAPAI